MDVDDLIRKCADKGMGYELQKSGEYNVSNAFLF
jgi:hypothetical protein